MKQPYHHNHKHDRKHKRKHSRSYSSQNQAYSSRSSIQSSDRRERKQKNKSKSKQQNKKHVIKDKNTKKEHKHKKKNNKLSKQIQKQYEQKQEYYQRSNKRKQQPYNKKQENDNEHANYRMNYQKQENIKRQQQVQTQKQLPCFQPSGILLEYYNSREGVSLKFHQPPEARQPDQQWRMYVFKGDEVLKPIVLSKSCYLIGKDDRIVDILAENPSISRQQCVIQFRLIQKRTVEGNYQQSIKPYIIDLESTNGTILNDERIESGRYYELLHKDVLKFGFSEREYVIVKWEGGEDEGL